MKLWWILMLLGMGMGRLSPAIAQTPTGLAITVNSAEDGPLTPDEGLTLREAIAIANGTLLLESLSAAEQAQIAPGSGSNRIQFDLPADATTIYLTSVLPPLVADGLTIDGTTQAGYGALVPFFPTVPTPAVSLTPAPDTEIFRGLTIAGNGITVKGLSLYGFWSSARATLTTPAADIFVDNVPPPQDASPDSPPVSTFDREDRTEAPQDIVIEQNWLGFGVDGNVPEQRSAFGVFVFNGVNVRITNNWIQHQEGSGVITGFRAEGLQLVGNAIIANGSAGMPDGVRLEGKLDGTTLSNNLVCANDGSGIFMFKPEGATLIQNNDIIFNGRRLERAAVYVMGQDHQILDNQIGYQPGPGVAVTAYPLSDRNLIQNNRFTQLDGLSIDLVARQNVGVQDFQQADGPNPPRNSFQRRRETANGAINAPEFAQYAFERTGNTVQLVGKADPGSEIALYRVKENAGVYSPLGEPLMQTVANAEGEFEFLWDAANGDWLSAIASDPQYGTSEPSPVISVTGLDGTLPPRQEQQPYAANCFADGVLVPTDPEPEPPVTQSIRLSIPRNIHFALDQANISPASARLLDQIAEAMQTYPSLIVELRGHTDPRASNAYNQALSKRRARAARDYLLRQGIAAERMRILPLGETQRRTTGATRLDYARDRRVEFIFQDTQGLEIIFEDVESDLQVE
ncbi:MAG: OmpA family protein [Cyanobacteria bacterium J06638_28]